VLQLSEAEYLARRTRLAINRKLKRPVPTRPLTAIRKAVQWSFPYALDDYPGQWKGFAGLLGVSIATLKHLLAGRREMSGEARTRLIEAMRAKLEQGSAILAELEAMPERKRDNPVRHINRVAAERNEAARELDKP